MMNENGSRSDKNRPGIAGEKSIVTLRAREEFYADGVTDILAFDETQLLIDTALGRLCVDGAGMHVSELSVGDGKLTLRGRIDAMYYLNAESKKKNRRFGRKD